MADEASITQTVKTASDGTVSIAVEKYNEMLEKIAEQKGRIGNLNQTINRLRSEPPIVHRTTVIKTPEMVSQDNRLWGNTFMGVGGCLFIAGALRRKAG